MIELVQANLDAGNAHMAVSAILGVLGAIGGAVGGAAGGAGIIGTAASLASTGVGIASAAGAFDPEAPNIPTLADPSVGEAQRLQRTRAALAKGRQSTIRSEGEGVDPESPLLARPTVSGPGGPGGV